jgi:hypothetical protein
VLIWCNDGFDCVDPGHFLKLKSRTRTMSLVPRDSGGVEFSVSSHLLVATLMQAAVSILFPLLGLLNHALS